MKGTVKRFDTKRGYGFITNSDGKDVFVHHSDIRMEGYRYFNEGDIVNFHVVIGNDGRECAINVKPILTLSMVVHELKKEGLHLMRIGDDKGIHGWYLVDKSDHPVIDKEMNLVEVATYVGFNTEDLTE